MKKSSLYYVKDEFLDSYSFICNLTDEEILYKPDDDFRLHFERLNRLAAMDVDDQDVEEILYDKKLQPVIKHISYLKKIYGLKMEIEFARSIMDALDPSRLLKRFKFYSNYLELARMEYQGGGMKPDDKVVFIGSGPLPMSLISLYKQYGVKGIGIEQVPEYANLSQKLIKALELTDSIRIISGNHLSLPAHEKVQLIMVGADACPKYEIFKHLAKTLENGTKLSYRIYEKGLRRLLDDKPVLDIPHELREYARIRPKPPVNNTSVFLVKDIGRQYKGD
ncbi:MAG: methyltransferase [Deltaproteobacteria bacterium]|nr:methyltransferase [Deltaproteobacteria bacterium]